MLRRIITVATYKANARDTFLAAMDMRELAEAMSGIAHYEGLPERPLEQGDTCVVDITTFKVFKTKGYEMFMEYLDKEACVLQSREKGGPIQMWDHHLSIRQEGEMAIWVDDVTINVGLITPVMARFAAYMYRRRHKFRKALNITTQIESLTV